MIMKGLKELFSVAIVLTITCQCFVGATQDQNVINRVYNTINKWRRNEGVPALKVGRGLVPIVQSAGFVTGHHQHTRADSKATAWGRKYGLYSRHAIIACTSSTGCTDSSSNFDHNNPAQIWYEYKDRTGHYNAAVNRKYKWIGCSADKKYQSSAREYGWGIWCTLMG